MKIDIAKEAVDFLKKKVDFKNDLLLAVDDGSNRYSDVGGSCTIGDKFQIVSLAQDHSDFPITVENEAGIKLFTSENEKFFLGNGLKLLIYKGHLALKDDNEMLDDNISINNYSSHHLTDEQREKLGLTVC